MHTIAPARRIAPLYAAVAVLLVHCIASIAVKRVIDVHVPAPYMDEQFHIPQVARYCAWDFSWDPKITTPPGLYVLTYIQYILTRLVGIRAWCSDPAFARSTNTLLGPLLVQAACSFLVVRTSRSILYVVLLGTTCAMLPPLYFFYYLYYTDVLSVAFVLWALVLSDASYHGTAAFFGLLSLVFRQTNIVWIMFMLGAALLQPLEQGSSSKAVFARLQDPAVLRRMCKIALPYIPALLFFLAFLVWNRGQVVLGDQSNHSFSLHLPQLGYFFAFALFFGWPLLAFLLIARRVRIGTAHLVWIAVLTMLGVLAVYKYTVVHPFMLADNRHYMFYVWRRILNAHPLARYALTPLYATSAVLWTSALAHARSVLWVLGLLVATSLALVPTPLIEPRYYVLPFMLMWLTVSGTLRARRLAMVLVQAAWFVCINASTIYLFLSYPFTWPHEPGMQRFMW